MLIERELYNKIVTTCPNVPPETGGILGGYKNVINTFKFDKFEDNCCKNSYRPNVSHLNDVIQQWANDGIEFYGLFHSHVPDEKNLSMPDKGYIQNIMAQIPSDILRLYFPIIFPNDKMVGFVARRNGNGINIEEDIISFVNADANT